jgi:hypothetical protein
MYIDLIVWDAEDDPDGNLQHIVRAGDITAEEVEQVLSGHHGDQPDAYSDMTGDPIIFGTTSSGERVAVVYCDESDADLGHHQAGDGLPGPGIWGVIRWTRTDFPRARAIL